MQTFLRELQAARDPARTNEALMGSALPKRGLPPTARDIHSYNEYMLAVQSALREPPLEGKDSA